MSNSKTAVIFYSLEGNTKYVAELISKSLNADLVELRPKKKISSNGFMKYFWGGKQAVMNERPELEPVVFSSEKYDTLFIGAPVWANTAAPPIFSFIEKYNLSGKNIALFSCFDGKPGKFFTAIKSAIPGNAFIGELGVLSATQNMEKTSTEVKEWLSSLKN